MFKKYQTQFRGQLIMAEESNSSLMFVIGRSLLDLGYVESLEEVLDKIEEITPEQLQRVARDVFNPSKLSFLTYVPNKV